MTTLLQINASISDEHGQSSQLAEQFVAGVSRRAIPHAKIVVRDVAAAEPVPHLNAERFGAFIAKPEERSDCAARRRGVLRRADRGAEAGRRDRPRLADVQLRRALAAEGVFRSHRTRRRDLQVHRQGAGGSAHRQEGLRVRGARRASMPARRSTRRRSYVRDFLRFLGMTDVEFVYAEGLAISPESTRRARQGRRGDRTSGRMRPRDASVNALRTGSPPMKQSVDFSTETSDEYTHLGPDHSIDTDVRRRRRQAAPQPRQPARAVRRSVPDAR